MTSAWIVSVLAIWCVQSCSGLTTAEKKIALKTHNDYRAQVTPNAANMRALEWDKKAETTAQDWADRCQQGHRKPAELKALGMGENLAYSTVPYSGKDVDSGIRLWYEEVKDYTYKSGTCAKDKVCGHYTQVVDTRSLKVGCATNKKKCKGRFGYMFVCNYSPGGNYNGQKPYESGSTCGSCQPETKYCKKGFCSDCKRGSAGCSCELNCGKGNKRIDSTCSCKCRKSWGPACSKPCKNSPACTGPGYDKWSNKDVCPHPFFSEACAAKCQPSCQ